MAITSGGSEAITLRQHLRAATSSSHDRLDALMRPASDWRSIDDYARFLNAQYAARVSVECWLSIFAPRDVKPPDQTPLLVRDLIAIGQTVDAPHFEFELANEGKGTALGVAWVLAGSSLGNRAILHDMKRALGQEQAWPHRFLSSTAMSEFWKTLRPLVEAPVAQETADQAARAATSVFEHFLRVSDASLPTETVPTDVLQGGQ